MAGNESKRREWSLWMEVEKSGRLEKGKVLLAKVSCEGRTFVL